MPFFDELIEQWGDHPAITRVLGEQHMIGHLSPDVVHRLATWSAIDDVIMTRRLVPPDLHVVNAGRPISPMRYLNLGPSPRRKQQPLVDPAKLQSVLQNGATLVLNNLQETLDSVIDASHELSRLVGERVQANAYATWGRTYGFDPHWDDHDVLVVQIEGEKHWDIYGPGIPSPLDHEIDAANTRPEQALWSGTLAPGDVLYLPRGWWHAVCGTGATSLHLTFGFQRRTAINYLSWLNQHFQREHTLRVDIPRGDDLETTRQHQKAVEESVLQLMRRYPVSNYIEAFTGELDQRARLNLASVNAVDSGPSGDQ